jgi:hypothetical protein
MHAPNDKRKTGYRTEEKSGVGFLILIAAVPFVLFALATLNPKASAWIAQAAEAEFAADGFVIDAPTQIAQPNMAVPVQTVRAY